MRARSAPAAAAAPPAAAAAGRRELRAAAERPAAGRPVAGARGRRRRGRGRAAARDPRRGGRARRARREGLAEEEGVVAQQRRDEAQDEAHVEGDRPPEVSVARELCQDQAVKCKCRRSCFSLHY